MDGIIIGPTVQQLVVGLFAIGGWYLAIRAAWLRHRTTMAVWIGFAAVTSAVSLVAWFSS